MNGWPSLDHVCPECGFIYQAAAPEPLTAISGALAELRSVSTSATDAVLRALPKQAAWSAMEYCCHIRDVLAVTALRLYRTRTEDSPEIEPMLNDVRARLLRYNGTRLDAVLTEVDAAQAGLADEAAAFGASAWQRRARRLGETRTAAWVLRHAAHEVIHHLNDVRRTIAAVAPMGARAATRLGALRIARQTATLTAAVSFYRDRVGLPEIGRFTDHDGYAGVLLDLPGTRAHMELVETEHAVPPPPHPESLLVLFLASWDRVHQVADGLPLVASLNPYWDRHGLTIVDPDGFRVVLAASTW